MHAAAITGIVLTKLDGTPKGGVVLPIKRELGLPVKFIGVGEQIDDLQPFDPAAFAAGLFNMEEPEPQAEPQAGTGPEPQEAAGPEPQPEKAVQAAQEPEGPEEKHRRFREFAQGLMGQMDRGEDPRPLLPELARWRDDSGLDRDDQRLVRNLLLTVENWKG